MIGLLTALSACSALAQDAATPWRVVETPHYRVHYPLPAEDWALSAAARLEEIRTRVSAEVGWTPRWQTQVVVQDPYSTANGMAIPLGHSPRMVLWTTPPGADSVIGHYRDWGELLLTHEDTHLVHLMMPPRGWSGQLVYALFGVAPITHKTPRWAIEGYATVVEGKLSGSGRPHGDLRATLLRRLAQEGRLPSYGELSGSSRWQGFGYAYLVGSAYLEWLEERGGEGSLRKLWRRMTAKQARSFDTAFKGVFGDSPAILYSRFCAEMTRDAMALEGARPSDAGTLFLDLSWSTGRPAVSPDGTQIAAVERDQKGGARLKIWATEIDADAVKKRTEKLDTMMQRDPVDARPIDPKHPPHKLQHTLDHRTFSPQAPRWMPAGESLIFHAWTVDGRGRRRTDAFRWSLADDRVRRLTNGADVRDLDPAPDGSFAVGVHGSFGRTALATIDLADGSLETLTDLRADVVVDHPRLSPDGKGVAWLQHNDGRWRLRLMELATGESRELTNLPDGASIQHIDWSRDGHALYASLGVNGFIEIWRVPLEDLPATPVTTSRGGAFAPTVTATHVYYTALQANGLELHRLALEDALPPVTIEMDADPILRRPVLTEPPSPPAPVQVTGKKWGVGRLEPNLIAGGVTGRGASNYELGLRLGDIIGRHDLLALGSLGDIDGISGGALQLTERGLPVTVRLHGWATQRGVANPWTTAGLLGLSDNHQWSWGQITGDIGGWAGATAGAPELAGFAEAGLATAAPRSRAAWIALAGQGLLHMANDQTARMGTGAVELGVGQRWTFSTRYELGIVQGGYFSLGGVTSGALPEPAQWLTIRDPIWAPNTTTGTVQDAMSWSVTFPYELFVQRRRVWGEAGLHPVTAAGLRVVQRLDEQPLVRLPPIKLDLGLACRLEEGVWDDNPCLALNDYTTWAGVTWGER